MDMLEIILINSIFVLFPLLCYMIYQFCMETASFKRKIFYLDFALITSCYFIFRFGYSYSNMVPKLMFHIPLIFAYLLDRKLSILVLSIVGVIYYNSYDFGLYVVLIEYLIYYVLYVLKQKNSKFEYLYIKLFIFFNTIISFFWLLSSKMLVLKLSWQLIIICVFYYFLINLMINLFKKFDQVAGIHTSLKDLQNVKDLRESIFKITHEIKNPIAVCKGYLDMFDVENKEHAKNYIPIMKDEINRTLTLLQDFLSLNKISINTDILDIEYLLEEVIDNFKPLLKEKNIELNCEMPDDEIFIEGDYNRLIQVFINLIKNSIESIDSDGIIKLELKEFDDKVEIRLKDTGEGISEENLKKLKHPFFTTKQNGTGLGVALSNEIIEAHGGNLEYFSAVGVGTETLVTLKK